MKQQLFILLSTLIIVGCGGIDTPKQQVPLRVTTMVASAASSPATQSYVGVAEECEATAVSFTGMGVIQKLLVNEGQSVVKGQLLAEIDDTQARNILMGAEAQMHQANDALQRYKMLHENGSLPEVQWVEIQSKVAQAAAQLEVAKKNLADCRLTAPVSGIIGKKLCGVGETVLPSQAVVNILDIDKVKIKVAIPETEIAGLTSKTPTSIRIDAIDQTYQGGKIEKGVEADALTHTYDVRIYVENKDHEILPGMVATVSIASERATTAQQIMLPITSIQKKADGSLFAWIIDKENTAHRATVEVGHTQGNDIVVTSGIAEGQRIVVEGYQKLSEGSQVVY